jgi:branched-chain amino acid transport system substrate-binding protein
MRTISRERGAAMKTVEILRLGAAWLLASSLVTIPLASRAADPVEIDVITALTGPGALLGKEEATSLGIEETTINGAGGIGGRPVKFVIADDQSNPQTAVQVASGLLAKGARILLGPSLVADCEAVAPLIRGKAVMFCISAGFHPQPNSDGYFSGVSTFNQLIIAIKYLRERGITKLASITSVDANGQDADRGIALALARPENKGMSLVAATHFTIGDLAVDAQMAHIKASGAQVVINYNTGSPFGTVLHGYSNVGLDVPIVTQPAALNYSVTSQFAAFLPKDLYVTGLVGDAPEVAPPGAVRAALTTYLNAFKAAGVQPDHSTALAWDGAMIFVAALKKLGVDATGPQINEFIQHLHGFAGMDGEYDFRTGPGGLSNGSVVVVRWNADKKVWDAVSRPGGDPK